MPYTGCNPRGMVIARDKALSKKILAYHRIRVPRFVVFPMGRKIRTVPSISYPVIVKSLIEEASTGISQASVVTSEEKLVERVRFIHQHVRTDAIVEQFIDGREVYSAVLGNHRLQVLPTWEIRFENLPQDSHRIATRKVKWDLDYQKKYELTIGPAKDLGPDLERHIVTTSKRIYRALGLSGYARIDFRLDGEGRLFFLEANPNPDIAVDEEVRQLRQGGRPRLRGAHAAHREPGPATGREAVLTDPPGRRSPSG